MNTKNISPEDRTIKVMLLQATLIANLDMLKVYLPNIYEIFKDYAPESSGVVIDDKGNVNLANNGDYVYKTEAKCFAEKQVDLFVQNPLVFSYNVDHQEDKDIAFEHANLLKKIGNKRKNEVSITNKKVIDEEQLDMFCMVGSGLGYQIESLFKQKKIVNFLLLEPSKDVFYAMLHCLELKPIIDSCRALGGRFSIRIGGSASGMVNAISEMLYQQGHFNVSRLFFYRHYLSDTSKEAYDLFKKIGYRWTSGWGFMEDEIISITHTLSNIQAGFKICKKPSNFTNTEYTRPVFIVGSGPSLDASIDYLKEHHEKIIIVSAGTSLKALLKNGIKPDIHIEMERTLETLPYLEVIDKQQEESDLKLSDIQIIALNTVSTQVLNKFKNPLLLTKKFDGGGLLIQKNDKLNRHVAPEYSNPTVTNTALATAAALGFKNIYLVGTDFGYLSESQHHSKDSIYYDETYFDRETVESDINEDKKVKGNFAEFVYTTQIFDSSRGNIELLLEEQQDLNVHNCSNGAFIRYAEPQDIYELTSFEPFNDKKQCLEILLAEAFENKQFTIKRLDKAISSSFAEVKLIIDQLLQFTNKDMQSREELSAAFHLQNALLMKIKERPEYQVTYWIIQGSFRYFQAYIMTNSYYYDDLTARNQFINYCLSAFRKHMKQIYNELLHSYNKPSKV